MAIGKQGGENPRNPRAFNTMARLGGFDLKNAAELNAMNEAESNQYNEDRLAARNRGISELLYMFSDALKGKDIQQGAQARQQNRMLMQQDQERIARQQQLGEFITNANIPDSQKALLGTLPFEMQAKVLADQMFGNDKGRKIIKGADGFNYFVDTGERVLSEVLQNNKDNMNLYSVTDGSGKRIKTITNPTKEDIDALNEAGLFVNKLPTPTDRGKGFDSGKPIEYKGWNDDNGLKTRYFATNTLINTGERLLKQLSENPDSVLTAADLAQYFERAKAEVGALGGRPENYTSHLKDNQQSQIKDLAQNAAVSESMLLDFTFQIAQARGQTGRGLSDKDFVIFQKIISAGLTADQKAAALTSFIEGIASEVNQDLTSSYNFYSQRLNRNADDKEAMTFVTGIDDLRAMPFRTIVNPFTTPSASSSEVIDNLLDQYAD